jgi:hypothetical protein
MNVESAEENYGRIIGRDLNQTWIKTHSILMEPRFKTRGTMTETER